MCYGLESARRNWLNSAGRNEQEYWVEWARESWWNGLKSPGKSALGCAVRNEVEYWGEWALLGEMSYKSG